MEPKSKTIEWLSRPPLDAGRAFAGKQVAVAGAPPGGFGARRTFLKQVAGGAGAVGARTLVGAATLAATGVTAEAAAAPSRTPGIRRRICLSAPTKRDSWSVWST